MMAFVAMVPAANPALMIGCFMLAAMATWLVSAPAKARRLVIVALLALVIAGGFAAATVSAFDAPCVRCAFDWFPVICWLVYPC